MKNIQSKKMVSVFLCACILVLLSVFFIQFQVNASKQEQNVTDPFDQIMQEYHFSVSGSGGSLTRFAYQNLIEDIEDKAILEKYEAKVSDTSDKISLTPQELVEIDFYSKNNSEREVLLKKIKGQTVDVQMKDEVILISYNPDIL